MRRDKDTFDPSLPSLLVTYGNTAKKHRTLDGDVIVLGRSSVCDFNLVSPEVAPVHCALFRVANGWKLRDYSGRPGTRVNGKPTQEVLIDDGDIIQVGAFSFQAHLPPAHLPNATLPPIPPELVEKLQRSRRRLAARALAFRRLLGERFKEVEVADARLAAERADLQGRSEAIRARERDFQLRLTRLELSERDLATDRASLEKEYRALQDEVERHSASVRVFRTEAEQFGKEMEERQREIETLSGREGLEERARQLDIRAAELAQLAEHLRRQQKESSEPVAPGEPADEMTRLLVELRTAVRELRGGERLELERLRRENEDLRRRLSERSGERRPTQSLRGQLTVTAP